MFTKKKLVGEAGSKRKKKGGEPQSPGSSIQVDDTEAIENIREVQKEGKVNLDLVWLARPLSPLQIISSNFIVEGKGLATLAAFLVQPRTTHIQVFGHCGQ